MAGLGLHPGRAGPLYHIREPGWVGPGDVCLRVRFRARRSRQHAQGLTHPRDHCHRVRRGVVLVSAASLDSNVALGVTVVYSALTDLWYGFGVALEPHNLLFCFLGVLIGNIVGVLPGMGVLATISILLPLTFGMKPVAAILMLAGVFYGAQYGGAICSILLNLPCHPPHAVPCLDGYPMTTPARSAATPGLTV